MGRYAEARDLSQATLDRQRRVLAADLRVLGKVRAARDLDQDILDRQRRVLGKNHPTP